MDLVVHVADEHVLTPYVYPASMPEDSLVRQFCTCLAIATFGGYALYLIFAALDYYYLFDHSLFQHPKMLKNQVQKELWVSLTAIPFMGLLTAPIFLAEIQGYSKLYTNIEDYGVGYWFLSLALYFMFNDCLIYWIHRGLHHPLLYKHLHKTHHRWLVPTPFASHAFHPVDGWAQSLPYHMFVFICPMHKMTYLGLFVLVNFWTISIHDGVYGVPKWLEQIVNGAAHHTDHHLYYEYNLGQYFTLWDKLGGTYRNPSPFEGNGPHDDLAALQKAKRG